MFLLMRTAKTFICIASTEYNKHFNKIMVSIYKKLAVSL